jgi:hypothetical protein
MAAPGALQQQTLILQDGVSPPGYAGTADAFMESIFPEKQGGQVDPDVLRVKAGRYHTLLRFDLSPLPPGAEVLSAVLSLYSYDADNSTSMVVEAYQVLRPWVDVEARWNGPRTGETWDVPGCAGAGTDRAATPCAAQTLAVHGRWYDFDVASVVSLWASGAADNYGLVLVPVSGANHHRFRSADAGWEQYRLVRPKLAITYLPGPETPTATATLPVSPTPTATSVDTATVTATPSVTATHAPTVEVTPTAPSTPSGTRTPDPRRTPVRDSLYPYPEQRIGYVAFHTGGVDLERLHAGFIKLENRGPTSEELALGLESCTVIMAGPGWCVPWEPYSWEVCGPRVEQLVTDNPGHLWFIANEPEIFRPGGVSSSEYARLYHELYYFIKGLDPTAIVGIGGVVLPSDIRIRWLTNVLNHHKSQYNGAPMPVDVWNIHNLLLAECPGEYGCPADNTCGDLCCSGGYMPREFWCSPGNWRSQEDQVNLPMFEDLIINFRNWMATREEARDKPLIITEMGTFTGVVSDGRPDNFSHERILQFMAGAFDFLINARDMSTGYAPDGYRLVQRWTWYSLTDRSFNGFLFDHGQITDFGLNFANYIARFLPAAPTNIFFQRGWTGYDQDCDTWIEPAQARPAANFLSVASDGSKKALLKFDLSVLPRNVEVVSATLSLRSGTHQNIADLAVLCYGIKRPWQIGNATWINATSSDLWEVAGCTGPTDRETSPASSVLVTSDNTTYSWDVTALARQWISNPSSNNGVVLEGQGSGSGYWTFLSSDYPEQVPYWMHRYRPKLELAVELPEPTPTPTHTPTPTATKTETATPTASPSATSTETVTLTPTETLPQSPTPTGTPPQTPTSTWTATATASPTATLTLTPTQAAGHRAYLPLITKGVVRDSAPSLSSVSRRPLQFRGPSWRVRDVY